MHGAQLDPLLEPPWVYLLTVAVWLGVSAVLSQMSGWASLAADFRAARAASGEKFSFVTVSMGRGLSSIRYRNGLFVTINDEGLYLSPFFLVRFLSPPLFIPWSQVESVGEEEFRWARRAVVRVRDHWPVIAVAGTAGRAIAEAYERVSGGDAIRDAARPPSPSHPRPLEWPGGQK